VIAHDGEGSPGVDHTAGDLERAHLPRAAIDKIPQKDGPPLGVRPDTMCPYTVAKLAQQTLERIGMAMQITDQIVHCDASSLI